MEHSGRRSEKRKFKGKLGSVTLNILLSMGSYLVNTVLLNTIK